jgi:hypothetical protein
MVIIIAHFEFDGPNVNAMLRIKHLLQVPIMKLFGFSNRFDRS